MESDFRDTDRFSKLPYLDMKSGILIKVPEAAYGPSFYPSGVNIELIFYLWAVVSEIQADFQNYTFEDESWDLKKKTKKNKKKTNKNKQQQQQKKIPEVAHEPIY